MALVLCMAAISIKGYKERMKKCEEDEYFEWE